jgi:hypothetical protein
LNQEKEVALNFMVCFGIHLQGLWDWNFGILTSGYFLLSRCNLGSHIVWFSWWVCKFAMVAISPPTLGAETQWWIMKTQSSKTMNTSLNFTGVKADPCAHGQMSVELFVKERIRSCCSMVLGSRLLVNSHYCRNSALCSRTWTGVPLCRTIVQLCRTVHNVARHLWSLKGWGGV